jgi:hypothetical protein
MGVDMACRARSRLCRTLVLVEGVGLDSKEFSFLVLLLYLVYRGGFLL